MKLEKREVTLNEYDSLRDIFYLEKLLVCAYGQALEKSVRKEVKGELLRLIRETGEELCFMTELMNGSAIQNGENA